MNSQDNNQPKKVHLEQLLPFIEAAFENCQTFTIPITGTSMLPMLVEGRDKVEVAKAHLPLKVGDLPLYRRKNGAFVLHRIVDIENGTYTMSGDNQFLLEKGVTDEQIIGITVAFTQNGKKIAVTDDDYLAYSSKMVNNYKTRYPLRRLRHAVGNVIKGVIR